MSEEYDDTNRGAAFKPFGTQQMILQGKLNIEGKEGRIILVKDETASGTRLIQVYQKIGVLFENDKKGNDKAPEFSGPLEEHAHEKKLKVAGWKKNSNGKNYMSLSVSEVQHKENTEDTTKIDDEIPF